MQNITTATLTRQNKVSKLVLAPVYSRRFTREYKQIQARRIQAVAASERQKSACQHIGEF